MPHSNAMTAFDILIAGIWIVCQYRDFSDLRYAMMVFECVNDFLCMR
jgi:hypothetical protein